MKASMFETLNHLKSEFFFLSSREDNVLKLTKTWAMPNKREGKFCADFLDIIVFNTCEEI